MEFNELKNGDKLYHVAYWTFNGLTTERELRCVTVKRIRGLTATLKGVSGWGITTTQFNTDWFPSKKGAYEAALRIQEENILGFEEALELHNKEAKYLKRKIEESKN